MLFSQKKLLHKTNRRISPALQKLTNVSFNFDRNSADKDYIKIGGFEFLKVYDLVNILILQPILIYTTVG